MFSINQILTSQGKPVVGKEFQPYMTMMINPWASVDKYSDGTTDTNGIASPDVNNIMYSVSATNNPFGFITSEFNKYLLNGATLDKFFDFDNRSMASNAYKYYSFKNFFNKYRRYLKAVVYPFLKDITKLSATQTVLSGGTMGIIRPLDSTTFVWLYMTTNTLVKARIGTIGSDGTITWGTQQDIQTLAGTASMQYVSLVALSSTKFAFTHKYGVGDANGSMTVCTVSGTTITAGTYTNFHTAAANYSYITKIGTDKVAVTYYDSTGGNTMVKVATISGTTPTWGSAVDLSAGGSTGAFPLGIASHATDAFVVIHTGSGSQNNFVGTACTASGTVITAGSETTIHAGSASTTVTDKIGGEMIKLIDTNKYLVVDYNATDFLTATIITVSGTAITANTNYSYATTLNAFDVTCIWESTAGSAYTLYFYENADDAVKVTISGTAVTFVGRYDCLFSSSIYCSNVGVYPQIAATTTYTGLMATACGQYQVGNYLVRLASSAIVYYMVGEKTTSIEYYNDDTIIGTAFTYTEPFLKNTSDITSDVMNENAYLKIKNTSGATRSLAIETILCEVE